MPGVIHRVQELVLVGEVANDEVDEAENEDEDSGPEYAIDDTYDVDQDWLREKEAILEYGGLLEFFVVCQKIISAKAP